MSWFDRLRDLSVMSSFDRSGFERHARHFDDSDLAVDLTGRTVLVTGATGGLGLATAEALAARGATVWVGSRSDARADAACAHLRARVPGAQVVPTALDVSSLEGIRRWVDRQEDLQLDVVIHNAGVLPLSRAETAEGHETTVATNLIGPFALTWHLREALHRSADPRVIWVSSGGMLTQKLDVGATFEPPGPFDGVVAYARTKRAEVVVAEQLQARLGDGVAVYSLHPGWADTPGVETSLPRFYRLMKRRLRTPAQGADTTVWLATKRPRPEPLGAFYFDRRPAPAFPVPGTRHSPDEARALWKRLCGVCGIDPTADWRTGL